MDEPEEKKICVGSSTRCRDRISSLPDYLLHLILSFLDAKVAVITSVLSKRWKYVWASTPLFKVSFNLTPYADSLQIKGRALREHLDNKRDEFSDLIRKVLNGRKGFSIDKVVFCCDIALKTSFVKYLMCYLVRHKVREINITYKISVCDGNRFPKCLYASETLEKLMLTNAGGSGMNFSDNESAGFQALRELRLCNIDFSSCGFDEEIFTRCPLLESLSLINCYNSYFRRLKISAPRLKKLEILYSDPPDNRANYDQFGSVQVSALILSHFKYRGRHPLRCTFDANMSSIKEVDIDIVSDPVPDEFSVKKSSSTALCLVEMLKGIQNAETVVLSANILQMLAEKPSVLPTETTFKWKNIKVNWSPLKPAWNFLLNGSPDIKLHYGNPRQG